MLQRLQRLVRHRWLDDRVHRAIPADLVQRLTARVGASEKRHTGEVRIYVESALPSSYVWRGATARQRAVTIFGKLRVWDTEHNNGVLIYLLLAEHAIEIVADRGLAQAVAPGAWDAIVRRMGTAFRESRYEDGLTDALGEVSALLVQHFPAGTGDVRSNELPDEPVLG
jgi:uncharacterized membrane protein